MTMPNMEEHATDGFLLGLFDYIIEKAQAGEQVTAEDALIAGTAGALGGIAPDALEPPTNPRHRKTAHSAAVLGLALLLYKRSKQSMLDPKQKTAISAFSVGYAGHIAKDSSTQSGIPPI